MSFLQISSNHQFFLIEFHSMQDWTVTTRDGVTRKRRKRRKHRRKLYRKNPKKKVFVNSRLKAIYIIGQRKTFCGQRIPESSCVKKETADIEILITSSRKGDREIMQPIRITSENTTRIRKWVQFSQFRSTFTKLIAIEKT